MSETAPQPAPRVSLALLVFIAFTGTLAMHIFVPALPRAALELGTDAQTVQMAITIYILGLALGQLVYGPLSDVIGRRVAVLGALDDCMIGLTLDEIIRIPERICVAGGLDKVDAIMAMLRGGYATILVTDEATAQALARRDG